MFISIVHFSMSQVIDCETKVIPVDGKHSIDIDSLKNVTFTTKDGKPVIIIPPQDPRCDGKEIPLNPANKTDNADGDDDGSGAVAAAKALKKLQKGKKLPNSTGDPSKSDNVDGLQNPLIRAPPIHRKSDLKNDTNTTERGEEADGGKFWKHLKDGVTKFPKM